MKKIQLTILFIIASLMSISQENLVVDGGFEKPETDAVTFLGRNDDVSKRSFCGEIYDEKGVFFRNSNWLVPIGSPDLYSSQPYKGTYAAGIWTIQPDGYTETLCARTIKPLTKDSTYIISVATKPHDRDSSGQHQLDPRSIGFIFSETDPTTGGYPLLVKRGKVTKAKLPIVLPKTDWSTATTEYKARGGERFVIVGGFTDPDNNRRRSEMRGVQMIGYVLIDELSISPKFPSHKIDSLSLSIYYEEGKSGLTSSDIDEINQFIENSGAQGNDFKVLILSYSSSKGDGDSNLKLSRDRAQKISEHLKSLGIPSQSIDTQPRGEVDDCDEHCRRTDIIVFNRG